MVADRPGSRAPLIVFDDATGESVEIDFRGGPRLGVVAREVTLLPRHWEWLGRRPGGASVALRKLTEQASRCLFAGDVNGLQAQMKDWPVDLRRYVLKLSGPMPEPS